MSTFLKTIIFFFITLFFCFSCKNEPVKDRKEEKLGFEAHVYHSAGDIHSQFSDKGIPTFFNLAKITGESGKSFEAILLCEKLSDGKKILVEPLASLSFDKDTVEFNYLITVPSSRLQENKEEDFFVSNYHLQSGIEEWFKAQVEFNECRNFLWQNRYKALLELD